MFKFKLVLFFVLIFFIIWLNLVFSQAETAESVKAKLKEGLALEKSIAEEIEHAFERALKNVEKDKEQAQEMFASELKEKLKSSISKWISQAKKQKESELGKLVNQKWELISKSAPKIHYDYYLRDYEYQENGIDIIKTESLVVPYKAELKVLEVLYVERERSPNVSDLRKFLYTVTTPLKINFDYKGEEFVLINIEKGSTSLKQAWPEEVLRKIRLL